MNDEDQSNDLLRSLQATLAMHAASAPPPPTATIADVMAPKQPREPAPKKKAPLRAVEGDPMAVLHARAKAVPVEVVESEAIVPQRDEPPAPAAATLTVTQALDRHDVLSILMECIGRGLTPAQAEEFMTLAAKFSKT